MVRSSTGRIRRRDILASQHATLSGHTAAAAVAAAAAALAAAAAAAGAATLPVVEADKGQDLPLGILQHDTVIVFQ